MAYREVAEKAGIRPNRSFTCRKNGLERRLWQWIRK